MLQFGEHFHVCAGGPLALEVPAVRLGLPGALDVALEFEEVFVFEGDDLVEFDFGGALVRELGLEFEVVQGGKGGVQFDVGA